MTVFYLFLGLVTLLLGAECLVRGAARLALLFRISPLVIGLTIVALGTSTPEVAVSLRAAFTGHPDLAVANIIGSSIFNILAILGLSAAIKPLPVENRLVIIDVPIMIAVHLLLLVFGLNGTISRFESFMLLIGIIAYTLFAIYKTKHTDLNNDPHKGGINEFSHKYSRCWAIIKQIAFIGSGLALCVLGANWLTDSAVLLARLWGISELVIGLTIVAASTSLPEVATSVVAAIRGQKDIAIGNVVGSNISNVLAIIGIVGLISPEPLRVAPSLLSFDLPVVIAVCFACLPIFFTGHIISRWEGFLFLGYYVAYVIYLILAAKEHDALPMFSAVMVWFVVPITLVTVCIGAYRYIRHFVTTPPPKGEGF